jgi:glucose/arabinose dehydrogenase
MTDGYTAAAIPIPDALEPKLDAMAILPDDRIAVGFHEAGQIYLTDGAEWRLFAEGLHEPFGLQAPASDELVVMQRPELTRLRDTNGDGMAEEYETISEEFGLAGNYDEFACGPATDSEGNHYVTLATANGNGMAEKRGEVRESGKNFGAIGNGRDAHVPHRGWVLKITPEGETIPWADGLRVGDGITVDSEDRLFVTDQQGGWVGMNKLFHVTEGDFCGFPSSLAWRDGVDPQEMTAEEFDQMRTPAAVKIPYAEMGISTVDVVEDTTGGEFGPFDGQLFVAAFVQPLLVRVMVEEVAGHVQGACTVFLEGGVVGAGTHRLTFGPNGKLWAGKSFRDGWNGDRPDDALRVISWDGTTPFAVLDMSLTGDGFDLAFTKEATPSSAGRPDSYTVRRYHHEYSGEYGSPKHDVTDVAVSDASVTDDGRSVSLTLGDLRPGWVYALEIQGVESKDGDALSTEIHYTLNRLQDGTTGNPQFG